MCAVEADMDCWTEWTRLAKKFIFGEISTSYFRETWVERFVAEDARMLLEMGQLGSVSFIVEFAFLWRHSMCEMLLRREFGHVSG